MFRAPIRDGVELRLLEEHHAATMFALVEQDREYLGQWLPWVDATNAEDDSLAFIRATREQFASSTQVTAGVFYHGQFAGVVGTHKIHPLFRKVELGYWLGQSFQGKGIMTDVCRALIAYLFEERDLHRIQICCAVGNAKSNGIPRRLNFTLEGTLRDADFANGRFHDLNVYGMLRRDWKTSLPSIESL